MLRDTPPARAPLTSRRSPIVARYRAAAKETWGLLLLDGPHLVADALAANVTIEHAVFATDASGAAEIQPLLARLSARAIDTCCRLLVRDGGRQPAAIAKRHRRHCPPARGRHHAFLCGRTSARADRRRRSGSRQHGRDHVAWPRRGATGVLAAGVSANPW
jgi:hypothetical protein